MHAAEEIAQEIYQVYSSGRNGIVLELERRQELEPVVRILQSAYFDNRKTGRAGVDIHYGLKKERAGISFAPACYQITRICNRKLEDGEAGMEGVLPDSSLAAAVEHFMADKHIGFVILHDFQLIDARQKAKLVPALLQALGKQNVREMPLLLITVDGRAHLPEELFPYIHLIEGRKPGTVEMKEQVSSLLSQKGLLASENFQREIVSYLRGFHCFEAAYLFERAQLLYGAEAFDEDKKRILELISSEKVKLLEKDRLLEWKMVKHADIANMQAVKKYLKESGLIMGSLDDAMENGVEVPKGILIMGLPGTGKSLFAQYAASVLKLPLIRLEMGRMMGGHVGDSERNLRNAQKQAEEMAPCILWIDEIEKGFSGADGKNRDGNDYLQRMTGGFLTWLQEKKSSCYIIATANSIQGMPPEFFRQGRFDRCFYTAMPSETEVRNILNVHLQKPGRQHVKPVIKEAVDGVIQLAAAEKRFMTGADAGALVSNAFRRLYLDYAGQAQDMQMEHGEAAGAGNACAEKLNKEAYDCVHLAEVMKKEFGEMKVFSETNGEQIAAYTRLAEKSGFVNASAGEKDSEDVFRRYDDRLAHFIMQLQEHVQG